MIVTITETMWKLSASWDWLPDFGYTRQHESIHRTKPGADLRAARLIREITGCGRPETKTLSITETDGNTFVEVKANHIEFSWSIEAIEVGD